MPEKLTTEELSRKMFSFALPESFKLRNLLRDKLIRQAMIHRFGTDVGRDEVKQFVVLPGITDYVFSDIAFIRIYDFTDICHEQYTSGTELIMKLRYKIIDIIRH
ncbi:MAG: hypothetical protein ACTSYO_07600 [Candidatus Ranarchaeia archaeon]